MPVPDPEPLSKSQLQAAAALLAQLSPHAAELGDLFSASGHELALVGGPVRDVFLRRQYGDLDLTTDAVPQRVLELVADWADQVWTIGIEFGTVGLRKGGDTFEITTYRSERYDRTSRKPVVAYGTSLIDDLARRDFTVNAMAARLPGYELVDPFGGLADIQRKVLRTPGAPEDSFTDDPLRILRAARFAAQLGFTVDPPTAAAMRDLAGLLTPPKVSAERISAELTKLLLSPLPGGPVVGIALLVDTGVADQIVPEVPRLRLESDEHYRHKDVYQHSLTVLNQAIDLEHRYGLDQDLVLRLAALLHDIGKPRTRSRLPDGRVAFHHHEVVGAKMARRRLTELRYGKDIVTDVSRLVELHLRFHGYGYGEWTDSAVRRYVTDAGPLLTRLHEKQGQGAAAGARLRRPGGTDRGAGPAGGAGQDPARPQRGRDHGDTRPSAGTARRPGLPAPAGAADGVRPARAGPGGSGAAGLGRVRRAGRSSVRPRQSRRPGSRFGGMTGSQPVSAGRHSVPERDYRHERC
jgi:poly(A) polymerase